MLFWRKPSIEDYRIDILLLPASDSDMGFPTCLFAGLRDELFSGLTTSFCTFCFRFLSCSFQAVLYCSSAICDVLSLLLLPIVGSLQRFEKLLEKMCWTFLHYFVHEENWKRMKVLDHYSILFFYSGHERARICRLRLHNALK